MYIYIVPTLDNDNTTGYNKTIAASESQHIRPSFFFSLVISSTLLH